MLQMHSLSPEYLHQGPTLFTRLVFRGADFSLAPTLVSSAESLFDLALQCYGRYSKSEDPNDLDQAISAMASAVELILDEHPASA